MLQEAADEFHDIESENSRSFTVGLAVANEHGAVMEGNDARVGDGDFEDVGREIFETSLAGGDGLGVDVPIDVPDIGRGLIEQLGLFHQIAELGSEDFRECFDGEKEVDSGGMPRSIG